MVLTLRRKFIVSDPNKIIFLSDLPFTNAYVGQSIVFTKLEDSLRIKSCANYQLHLTNSEVDLRTKFNEKSNSCSSTRTF